MNNYWFPYLTIIVNIFIIWFMPKNLTKKEIYHAWWILASITIYTDLIFGDVLDLFDFGPTGIQVLELPIEALLPPSFGIIFLNFLPKYNQWSMIYILCWTAFSVAYEGVTIFIGYENLKGWTLWFSAPIYLLVFIFLKWHLHYSRNNNEEKAS